MSTRALRFVLVLLAGLIFAPSAHAAGGIAISSTVVDPTSGRIQLDVAGANKDFLLDPGLIGGLANARAGDIIGVRMDNAAIVAIESIKRPVSASNRLAALAIALLCLVGAAALAARGRPQQIGVDNRYSNSQTPGESHIDLRLIVP